MTKTLGVTGFQGDIILRFGVNARSYEEAEEELRKIGTIIQKVMEPDYVISKEIKINNIKL